MKFLDKDEFSELFYAKINCRLNPIEAESKLFKKTITTLRLVSRLSLYLSCVAQLLDFMLLQNKLAGLYIPNILSFLFFVSFLGYLYCRYIKQTSVQNSIKNNVFRLFFDALELDYVIGTSKNRKKYAQILQELNLKYSAATKFDDIVFSEADNPFLFFNCIFSNNKNGLIFGVKTDKAFYKEIYMKNYRKNIFKNKNRKEIFKKQQIFLEDMNINSLYAIYSDNEKEVKDLLSSEFLTKLKEYNTENSYSLDIIFSKKTYLDFNVFFLVNMNKNIFEIPFPYRAIDKKKLIPVIDADLRNIEYYYKLYTELVELLSVAVILNSSKITK